jgi:hypothetical protein
VAYVRTVKTASGATAVQIVYWFRGGSRRIEHLGSAHDDAELEALKAAAQQRLAQGPGVLDFGLDPAASWGAPLPITSSRMGYLCDALRGAYTTLGFDDATGGDAVFRDLVAARIIEPTSKLDSLRVLSEVGIDPASYATVKRRLPVYAEPSWRQRLAAACATHAALGPASLVLYDVSTLYFETDRGDGFREPGFSKERRLDPQITIGLLTDAAGFALMVEAFEGNKAETKTMLPTITAFMAAHELADVTVVADAGMVSDANKKAIEAAGLSFIIGAKIPHIPHLVTDWRNAHPREEIPDGHVFTQPWPAGPTDRRRNHVIYYQYRADRARRTLRGIDEQIAKAERAVAGKEPVKRNRFIKLVDAKKSVNRDLEAKARGLAGLKAYITNIERPTPEFVIGAYHRLYAIEQSFRMSKHDLKARPIYHHKRESIDAHLTVVFAALAVGRLIEDRTGWSIKKFVRTARRYRTVEIRAGGHTVTAEGPLPAELRDALARINRPNGAHQFEPSQDRAPRTERRIGLRAVAGFHLRRVDADPGVPKYTLQRYDDEHSFSLVDELPCPVEPFEIELLRTLALQSRSSRVDGVAEMQIAENTRLLRNALRWDVVGQQGQVDANDGSVVVRHAESNLTRRYRGRMEDAALLWERLDSSRSQIGSGSAEPNRTEAIEVEVRRRQSDERGRAGSGRGGRWEVAARRRCRSRLGLQRGRHEIARAGRGRRGVVVRVAARRERPCDDYDRASAPRPNHLPVQ